ncbi:FlxA-like family protein [Clostridium lundense]|uniref:FlxA-like family protein n=1 Tax=Clostridium lundense TaxID=319475 RepID=UPI00047FCD8D|nr:FlxA-like family protein [Clostridium lundense]
MNISSISSRNTNNSAFRTKNIDNQIKLLEKQKANVQEQISKIKERKISEQQKAELTKPLEEQIRMLDQQIQQKQMEKMNKDEDSEGGKNTKGNSKAPKATEDSVKFSGDLDNLVKSGLTYSKMKTARGIKVKLDGESKILKMEAAQDRARALSSNVPSADRKEGRASEIETRVSKLEKKMAKENAEVRNAVNKGEEIKDTEKNKDENEVNKERRKNINVLA